MYYDLYEYEYEYIYGTLYLYVCTCTALSCIVCIFLVFRLAAVLSRRMSCCSAFILLELESFIAVGCDRPFENEKEIEGNGKNSYA